MRRLNISPRANWQARLEQHGFLFHTGDESYWNESACYEFTLPEVDAIEQATNDLQEICAAAVQTVIDRDWFERLNMPPIEAKLVVDSWNADQLSVYGRFDLAWSPNAPPKMLEYNADTPTSLYEAAVIQWDWLQEVYPGKDQYNSLHERLIARWPQVASTGEKMFFLCLKDHVEDLTQTEYLRDTAQQAGLGTEFLFLDDLGWDSARDCFVDLENLRINQAFKLYPWEWLLKDEFGPMLAKQTVRWTEPAWKMVLSNKAILPLLWELNPNHPNLLPAWFEKPTSGRFVEKPFQSREGSRIRFYDGGRITQETAGPEESWKFIYQALQPLPVFDGKSVVIGSWIVGEEAAGMGLREDVSPITGNASQFVPHYINSPRRS